MPEEFNPVGGPVAAIQLAFFIPVFAASLASLWFLAPALQPVYIFLAQLALLAFALFTIHSVLPAVWVSWTERYAIDRGYVRIRKPGWMGGIVSDDIPVWKVSEVRVIMPPLLRLILVGSVEIVTDRGYVHTLRNVKNPEVIAERIRLYPSCQASVKTP